MLGEHRAFILMLPCTQDLGDGSVSKVFAMHWGLISRTYTKTKASEAETGTFWGNHLKVPNQCETIFQ